MEITLKNEQAQFEALKTQAFSIAEQCAKLKVTDEVSKAITTQNLSKALQIVKQIEEIRVNMKKPYKNAGDSIDALAKALKEPITTSIEAGKTHILAYDKIQRDKAAHEATRILLIKTAIQTYSANAIAEMDKCTTMDDLRDVRTRLIVNAPLDKWAEFKQDFENTRHTLNEYSKSIKTKLTAPEESAAIKEIIVADNSNIGVAETIAVVVPKLAGSRKTWTFEVIDFNQIPRDMLILNEALVKEFISANKESFTDGCIIKGIKYYQKETLTIR